MMKEHWMLDSRKLRYLLGGGWNTLFGYAVSLGLYTLLSSSVHIIGIAIIANFVAISMSFLTYKLFVFQTNGNWIREYLRSYLVYGNTAIVGIIMLWLLVDFLATPFWIAQGLIILITVVVSYFGHARFTFRK